MLSNAIRNACRVRTGYGIGNTLRMITSKTIDDQADWMVKTKNIIENQVVPSTDDVLQILSNVQRLGYAEFDLPSLVVLGDQSSGKTTLIENILRCVLSPTSNDEATRKVINIGTYPSNEKFFMVNGIKYTEIVAVQDEIKRLNNYSPDDFIHVECHSPELTLGNYRDTPGLKFGQRADKYRKLATEMINMPNTLSVVARSASRDPATVQALQLVEDMKSNVIEVITKFDQLPTDINPLVERFNGVDGYKDVIGTICVTEKDINKGITYYEGRSREAKFFSEHPQFRGGVKTLIEIARRHTTNGLIEQIPEINAKLAKRRDTLEKQAEALKTVANGANGGLISKLESLLKKFHGSGSGLIEFETAHNLQKPIDVIMHSIHEENGHWDIKPTFGPNQSSKIRKLIRNIESIGESRTMRELFMYGNGEPVLKRSEKEIDNAVTFALNNSLATKFINFKVKDNFDENGMIQNHSTRWHYHYDTIIKNIKMEIIGSDIISSAVTTAMMSTLDRLNYDNDTSDVPITNILEGFVSESVQYNIENYVKSYFDHIMNTTKRVEIDPEDFPKYLSRHANFAEHFKDDWGLYSVLFSKKTIDVTIHDDIYTYVVLSKLADRVTNELSKSIGVDVVGKISYDVLMKVLAMNDKEEIRNKLNKVESKITIIDNIMTVNNKFRNATNPISV